MSSKEVKMPVVRMVKEKTQCLEAQQLGKTSLTILMIILSLRSSHSYHRVSKILTLIFIIDQLKDAILFSNDEDDVEEGEEDIDTALIPFDERDHDGCLANGAVATNHLLKQHQSKLPFRFLMNNYLKKPAAAPSQKKGQLPKVNNFFSETEK